MSYFLRPFNMARIGDYYYPEGMPVGSSEPVLRDSYTDQHGQRFYICYTQTQVQDHIKQRYGIFMPFIPLGVTA